MRTAKMAVIVWWGFVTCAAQADLTLPFEGSSDTLNAAFKVTNSNTLEGAIECPPWAPWCKPNPDPRCAALFSALGPYGMGVVGRAEYDVNDSKATTYGGHFVSKNWSGIGVYGSAMCGDPITIINGHLPDTYGGYFEATHTGIYAYGTVYGARVVSDRGTGAFVVSDGGTAVRARGTTYDFYASGTAGTTHYGVRSSIRWKTDIQPIDEPLQKVLNLRGVYFNWDAEHGGGHDMGMIAEEVGDVLPEVVQYEDDGVYASGMDYSKIVPLLVEAIKELNADNQSLRRRLDTLEGTLEQD